MREPLLVLDSDLRLAYANAAFFFQFRVSREETERKFLYRLGNEQWNIPKLRALLEKVAKDDTPVSDYEVTHDFPDLGTRTMLLNALGEFTMLIGMRLSSCWLLKTSRNGGKRRRPARDLPPSWSRPPMPSSQRI